MKFLITARGVAAKHNLTRYRHCFEKEKKKFVKRKFSCLSEHSHMTQLCFRILFTTLPNSCLEVKLFKYLFMSVGGNVPTNT